MDDKSSKLDHWRDFFRTANSDIFEVIEHAILVAASDCPEQFQMRRDQIAEKLYTCRLILCSGCDRFELAVPHKEEGDGRINGGFKGGVCGGKESKVNSSTDDRRELNSQNWISNYTFDEAEALTEELEEENQLLQEVLRIKEVLSNKDETESTLFESLRKLQLMGLSVEILKATEIGRYVNFLRKRGSNQIRDLARTLVDGWKHMVDEWVNATAAIAGSTPESENPSVVEDEEEGLPSPPLDEGAFFATQPTSMELSQFFDGMDDDGNPRNNAEFNMNNENGRKPVSENDNRKRKQSEANAPKENKIQICKQEAVTKQTKASKGNLIESNAHKENKSQIRKQVVLTKQTKPSKNGLNEANAPTENKIQRSKQEFITKQINPFDDNFGPGRPPKLSSDYKTNGDTKLPQQLELSGVQKKPPTSHRDNSLCADDLVRLKLEASGRNLQERYQQLENAKKQRTIQVMELCDLPKQGTGQRNSHFKPGVHNQHRANGRR